MAVDASLPAQVASASQVTLEKAHAREDSDSNFQPFIKPAFNFVPPIIPHICNKQTKRVNALIKWLIRKKKDKSVNVQLF